MEKSPEEEGQATVSGSAGEAHQLKKSKVRRRLVQSTLLPHKPTATESKEDVKGDNLCNADNNKDGDDVECCGSEGKKRGRKRKENTQIKTPKYNNKKVKDTSSPEATSETDADATPKKPVKRAYRKNSTPRKNVTPRKNATPKKNGIINGKTAAHSGENGDALFQIPNLRLEAKMMAEENSKVFGGKQIHPFFLSRNVGTKCDDKTIQKKAKGTTFGPIHVFEREQDGAVSLDWRNWNFCEKSFVSSGHILDGLFSSIFECTVKPLCFDKFPSVLHTSSSSLHQGCWSSNGASVTAVFPDVQDQQVDEVGSVSGHVRKSDEQRSQALQERIVSFHLNCANKHDSRLWTDKYQPKKAVEICGNEDSVKFLNEWLQNWCQRGLRANKDHSGGDERDIQDPDYNIFQSDSDSENIGEEGQIKNVVLITGPVGSGKSAAIYACAKEQGFKVIEANASECRNGVIMKERFGALESQSTLDSQLFQWSQESSIEFQSVDDIKSPTAIPNTEIEREIGDQVIEVIPISDEDILHGATMSQKSIGKDDSVAYGQGQLKPLILFEDVDVVFPDDRGFVSAIQQIADKVKGPVILTCSSDRPLLPDSLDRVELCFKMPLEKELLQHLCMVCSAENVNVQCHLVKQLIEFCQRDIRKAIMHLQFWCQGEQSRKGTVTEVQRLTSLLPFDLEGGYQIFPKMIPWEFPSQLSELVEKEIRMSLCKEEVTEKLEDNVVLNDLEKCISETDSIEAKKKAMLSKNCSDNEFIDLIDYFDSSSNPLPACQRNSRRKFLVMSSDSEDELLNGIVPTTPDKDANNELCLEIDSQFPSHFLNMQKNFSLSTDLQLCSGADKLEENLYQCSQTSIDLNEKDMCTSIDVSCVPESSFVPETEINDGMKILFGSTYCDQVGHAAEILEEASVSNEFRHVLTIEADKFEESMHELHEDSEMLDGACENIAASSHEGVEDTQNELLESISRAHQLMDECSCINFSRKVEPHENCGPSTVIDSVGESWRKLRDRRGDLRHFVAAEQKCFRIIKLADGMSNLISEAELLHNKCRSLDSVGSAMVYLEESDAFNWYNEQMQMASAILEHGFCFYAKDLAAAGTDMGFDSREDLTHETSSTNSKIKVGGLHGQNINRNPIDIRLCGDVSLPENATHPKSEKPQLVGIIRSVVPSRAYMAIKGNEFCDYLSSLAHMSRSESSRLSEGVNKTNRRRGRAARNYLRTGSLMLSPEEISLLGQSNIYGKVSAQSTNTDIS